MNKATVVLDDVPDWLPFLLFASLFAYLIGYAASRRDLPGVLPMSKSYFHSHRRLGHIGRGLLCAGAVSGAVGIAAGRGSWLLGLALVVSSVLVYVGRWVWTVDGSRDNSGEWIRLRGVSRRFAHAITTVEQGTSDAAGRRRVRPLTS